MSASEATPRLLQQCYQDALSGAPELLARCIDAAVVGLQGAEKASRDIAQRDLLARAGWALQQNKGLWLETYPAQLREALMSAADDAPPSSRPALYTESTLMSLVDDDALKESLESARLVQNLLPVVEHELAVLDALMSSLVGLVTVRAERNPLRPLVFVRVLRETMASSDHEAAVRSLWLQHMAAPLGAELKKLYERLGLMLQRANVREAGYRVRLSPDGPVSTRSGGLGWSPNSQWQSAVDPVSTQDAPAWPNEDELPPMIELARQHSGIDNPVFHGFLNQGGAQYERHLTPAYYDQVSEELAAIEAYAAIPLLDESMILERSVQHRDMPVVDRPARAVGIASQLSQKTWGAYAAAHERAKVLMRLKQKARRVAQAVGLDLVRALVGQLASDPLLLTPVREAVVALEPALLRLAMDKPRFFSEEEHPARLLVEGVAQRSFKYNDEFSSDFETFFQPVQRAFNRLNAQEDGDPKAFATALTSLRRNWDAQDQQERPLQDNSLQSMRRAEERQALADQLAWDMSQRPDVDNAPGVILDFLYGPWCLVMASAQLGDASGQANDPGGYGKAVSQLLWSVKKEVTLRRPKQLFDMIPGLLSTLYSGLDSLGKTREETKPFFDALMRLHQPVLRLRRARIKKDAVHSAPAPLEIGSMSMELDETLPATPEQRRPHRAAQPWLGKDELVAAGFEDTLPSYHADLVALRGESPSGEGERGGEGEDVSAPTPVGEDSEALGAELLQTATVLGGLREGDWVDLYAREQWLRAQLIWASSKGTLFMFVSGGGQPHSMTKRSCERLIANRLLRPVAAHGVVTTALRAMTAETPPSRSRAAV
ncbi:DUF1631 family protein [Hydrogenophaga sp.]|uniref:DUF1631 family protein n=1 Tax=Hydrogenophaga sp. TaxID=1904254 RepID=UPI00356B1894